jgi:hypothetical protein
MINLKQSIEALRLAIKIVHGNTSDPFHEAKLFLTICRLGADSPPVTDAVLIETQRKKARPWFPIILLICFIASAVASGMIVLLVFIPAFVFAAYGAWLYGQALDQISLLLANNEEA